MAMPQAGMSAVPGKDVPGVYPDASQMPEMQGGDEEGAPEGPNPEDFKKGIEAIAMAVQSAAESGNMKPAQLFKQLVVELQAHGEMLQSQMGGGAGAPPPAQEQAPQEQPPIM